MTPPFWWQFPNRKMAFPLPSNVVLIKPSKVVNKDKDRNYNTTKIFFYKINWFTISVIRFWAIIVAVPTCSTKATWVVELIGSAFYIRQINFPLGNDSCIMIFQNIIDMQILRTTLLKKIRQINFSWLIQSFQSNLGVSSPLACPIF